jgi:hypothetical protein
MKTMTSGKTVFAGGLGTGIALILLGGALAAACRPGVVASLALKGMRTEQERSARRRDRRTRRAQSSPDYLDVCRAAGL